MFAHVTTSFTHNGLDVLLTLGGVSGMFWLTILANYLKGKFFMPCDTITTVSVELGKVNPDLLFNSLKALGLNPIKWSDNGTIYFGPSSQEYHNPETGETKLAKGRNAAEIKRAYSAEIIKSQAKRYGWSLKETAPFQYTVVKR